RVCFVIIPLINILPNGYLLVNIVKAKKHP
ncbi:MAG: hypothetical protein ACI81A_001836, partial [Paraglaciecola sp.]